MSSAKHKLCLASALCALAIVVSEVGCTGFFVNPTLSSIVVGPASPTILIGGTTNNTVQMTVFGTNNDGSTANNVPVAWTITPTGVATISSTGLVTSVALGTATVTATANANPSITGTQTVTVSQCVTSITIKPTSGSVSNNTALTVQLTATATPCNNSAPVDVTSVATWTSSNTSLATVSAGLVSGVAGLTSGGTVTVTASIGSVISNTASITVSP